MINTCRPTKFITHSDTELVELVYDNDSDYIYWRVTWAKRTTHLIMSIDVQYTVIY